jgi:CDP-diacylglycerol pyrophosphatase
LDNLARSRSHRGIRRGRLLVALGVLITLAAAATVLFWRDALWGVIEVCSADERLTGLPYPCASVDRDHGFALLWLGTYHDLLSPLTATAGIETPALTATGAENYFADAWAQRGRLDGAAGKALPRNLVGLAVNSAEARTQDQLHIHIGCVRSDVVGALTKAGDTISAARWTPIVLAQRNYFALRADDASLAATNPFAVLAAGLSQIGAADMASQTLVVAGATFSDGTAGFYLLTSRSAPNRPAIGERLLDYGCRGAR